MTALLRAKLSWRLDGAASHASHGSQLQKMAPHRQGRQAFKRLCQGTRSGRGAAHRHREMGTDDAVFFSKSRVAHS